MYQISTGIEENKSYFCIKFDTITQDALQVYRIVLHDHVVSSFPINVIYDNEDSINGENHNNECAHYIQFIKDDPYVEDDKRVQFSGNDLMVSTLKQQKN